MKALIPQIVEVDIGCCPYCKKENPSVNVSIKDTKKNILISNTITCDGCGFSTDYKFWNDLKSEKPTAIGF